MARKLEITRTVEATKAVVLCFNKSIAEAENLSFTVSGRYTADDRKLAKQIVKLIDNPDLKFIEVVDVEDASKLYGISLQTFLTYAVELDPKTRQPLSEKD